MKKGYFYLMKLDGERIKFGFSTDIAQRLRDTQTYVPDASLIRTWDCPLQWYEEKAIEYLKQDLPCIGGEVFTCPDLPMLIAKIDTFFQTQLPILRKARREARDRKIAQFWESKAMKPIADLYNINHWNRPSPQ